MADILLISGSPTASSRSGALLTYSQNWLRNKTSFETVLVSVRDFPADDLILAKYDSPAFDGFKQQISNAAGIIVSTPIYKAAYTGSLKALPDILPQNAFRGKTAMRFPPAYHGLASEARSPPLKIFSATKFSVDEIKATTIVEYTNPRYK